MRHVGRSEGVSETVEKHLQGHRGGIMVQEHLHAVPTNVLLSLFLWAWALSKRPDSKYRSQQQAHYSGHTPTTYYSGGHKRRAVAKLDRQAPKLTPKHFSFLAQIIRQRKHTAIANQQLLDSETYTQLQALYVTNLGRGSERARGLEDRKVGRRRGSLLIVRQGCG